MQILQVTGLAGPGPIAGGVWTVAQTQTNALRRAGHEVRLIGGWLGESPPGRDYIQLKQLIPGAGLRAPFARGLRAFLMRAAQGVDVVHLHLARDHMTTSALSTLGHLPMVLQAHGMLGPAESSLTRLFDRLYKSRYVSSPATWLAVTNQEVEALIAYGIKSSRIERVDNAAEDVHVNVSRPRSSAGVVFSFISRLHPRKQPEVFVEAGLRLLSHRPDVRFRIVGPDQGALEATQALVAESGQAAAFEFVGPEDRSGVINELMAATAVVLPSRGEIAPMIAIEAAAARTPLVLTRDCGLADQFEQAGAAIVVEPTVDGVFEAMCAIAADPDGCEAMTGMARILYESTWTLDALARRLEEVYWQVSGRVR